MYNILLGAGANLDNISIVMNNGVKVERGQAIELDDRAITKLKKSIESQYRVPKKDIKVSKMRILPRLSEETVKAPYYRSVEIMDVTDLKNATFKVVVEDQDGRSTDHVLYASLYIETTVLVAKDEIAQDTTLQDQLYIQGRQEITRLDEAFLRKEDLLGRTFKFKKTIKKDEIFKVGLLRDSVVVQEGATVTLSYKSANLSVSTLGKLKTTAEIGQVVRVENVNSQRVVNGTLISKDIVEVAHD